MVHRTEVEIAKSLKDMDLPEDDVGAGIMAFSARLCAEIVERGKARGLPVPDLNAVFARFPPIAVEYLFPNYFLLPMFSAMSSYRIRPLGPESCLFEIWSLAHLADDDPREPLTRPNRCDTTIRRSRRFPGRTTRTCRSSSSASCQGLRIHAAVEGRRGDDQQLPAHCRRLSSRRSCRTTGERGVDHLRGIGFARRRFRILTCKGL